MKTALFGLALAIITPPAMAQTAGSCSQSLRLARSVYDKGRLQEIPTILQPCLQAKTGGFTKAERQEALRLLTLSYLYSDEPEKADEGMLNLLKEFHYYKPNREVDPAEYAALFNTFRTEPVYRVGVKFGMNVTKPRVVSSDIANRAADRDSAGHVGYKSEFSYMGGVAAEIPLFKNIIFNPELYFFSRTFSGFNSQPGAQEVQLLSESLKMLSMPLALQYTVDQGWMIPYASLGVSINYLLKSDMQLQINRVNNQSIDNQPYVITKHQKPFSFDVAAALGVKFTAGPGKIILEARYWHGLSDVNSKDKTFENSSAVWNYHYVDPVFKTSASSMTIGYVLDVFNPKKKKKLRMKK